MNAGFRALGKSTKTETFHGAVFAMNIGFGLRAAGVAMSTTMEGCLVRMLGRAHRKRGCRYGCCREDGMQLSSPRYRKMWRAAEKRLWRKENEND